MIYMTKRNLFLGSAAIMFCIVMFVFMRLESQLSYIAYHARVESVDGKVLGKTKIVIQDLDNQPSCDLAESIMKIKSPIGWSRLLLLIGFLILACYVRNPYKPKEFVRTVADDTDRPNTKTP